MTNQTSLLGLEFRVLCLVARKYEPDTTALSEEHNRVFGKNVGNSSVYNAVERLVDRGFVAKQDMTGRRNFYILTEDGAKYLQRHQSVVSSCIEAISIEDD